MTAVNNGTTGTCSSAVLRLPRLRRLNGSSYGDGRPSRRFGQQFATAPICSGCRSGYGREIGPRCRRSEIARQCGAAVETGKAVWETRRPFSVALTLRIVGLRESCARRRGRSRRRGAAWYGAILSFISARISGGAVSGEPELNGGAGLYSSRSWIASAVLRSTMIDTSVSAKSIPAVTPPPVMRLRSTQTRVLVGVAPKAQESPSRSSASPRDSPAAGRPRPAPAIPCRPR